MLTDTQVRRWLSAGGHIIDVEAYRGDDFTTLSGQTLFELADGLLPFLRMINHGDLVKISFHMIDQFKDHGHVGIGIDPPYDNMFVIHIYVSAKERLEHLRRSFSELCSTSIARQYTEPDDVKLIEAFQDMISDAITNRFTYVPAEMRNESGTYYFLPT